MFTKAAFTVAIKIIQPPETDPEFYKNCIYNSLLA